MSDKTYNGWTNYETWNVALWIGNEQGSEQYWAEEASRAWDFASDRSLDGQSREEEATIFLSDQLKESFEEQWQEIMDAAGKHISASVWADLMGAALSEVNWYEIAEHLIEDVDKENKVVSD